MALQGSLTLDNGITLSQAYLVVLNINSNYVVNDNKVIISIAIFKDASAYSAGKPEVSMMTHTCSGSSFTTYFDEAVLDDLGKTSLTQAYVWLATLSAYSGMTSV